MDESRQPMGECRRSQGGLNLLSPLRGLTGLHPSAYYIYRAKLNYNVYSNKANAQATVCATTNYQSVPIYSQAIEMVSVQQYHKNACATKGRKQCSSLFDRTKLLNRYDKAVNCSHKDTLREDHSSFQSPVQVSKTGVL